MGKESRKISIPPKVRRFTDQLPVSLTDEERLEFADRLAEANQAVENAEANRRSSMQMHSSEIKIAQARREKLNGIVASKTEYRDVVVEERWDYDNDRYTRTRTDTGQIISERRLSDKEKQLDLLDESEEDV